MEAIQKTCPVCGQNTARQALPYEIAILKNLFPAIKPGDMFPVRCRCAAGKQQEEQNERMRQLYRERAVAAQRKRMPRKYLEMTFAADDGKNLPKKEIALRYAAGFETMYREGKGLLFTGGFGTGKTFYACAIMNALMDRGFSAEIITPPGIMDLFTPGREEERARFWEHLTARELYIIDDFGASRDSEFGWERMYEVIDRRLNTKKPLLLTTNFSLAEMREEGDLKRRRIFDRLFEMTVPVTFGGESRRVTGQEERNREAVAVLRGRAAGPADNRLAVGSGQQ